MQASIKPPKRLANPLALAVLVLLFERPMHPYEMAATLKEREKDKSIKLNYGSLYTVIEQLLREGFIAAGETVREGKRPEKTVYSLTPAGAAEMDSWLRELVAQPVKEYPRFETALSLLPALPPDVVLPLLNERVGHLQTLIDANHADAARCAAMNLPRLFQIEGEYQLTLLSAELGFVQELATTIRERSLGGLDFWEGWHAERQARESAS